MTLIHTVLVVFCAAMPGCSPFGGAGIPDAVKPQPDEGAAAYRNRIAKDFFAGTWEAVWDHSDVIFPDGTNGGTETIRLHVGFSPTQTSHGLLRITNSRNGDEFAPGGAASSFYASWQCNSWELVECEASRSRRCTGRIRIFPQECADGPTEGPLHDLVRMRLKSEREKPTPFIEFVIENDTTIVQANGSRTGGLQGELNLFQNVTWRRVAPGPGGGESADPSSSTGGASQQVRALQATLDADTDLLPAEFELQDLYASVHVSKFLDGTFDVDRAQAAATAFALEALSHGREAGAIPAALVQKELAVFQECGYLTCAAKASREQPLRAVVEADGRTAVQLSVNVVLTRVLDSVPRQEDSRFATVLGGLVCQMHGADKPLHYTATVFVSPHGDGFRIDSHGMEGEALTTANLETIVRRNVMTLLSTEAMGLVKKASMQVMFPDRQRDPAADARAAEPAQGQAEGRRAQEHPADSPQSTIAAIVASIPSRMEGVKVDVALSSGARDQLRHGALDVGFFAAVGDVWGLEACRRRSQPDYAAQELAQEAAQVIREFGIISVTCDLQIGKPVVTTSKAPLRIPVGYRVRSVDVAKPGAASSWIAEATWSAVPDDGAVTLEFPIEEKQPGTWRCGVMLPTGPAFGRDEPVLAWGDPADVLSPLGVACAANRAVSEAIASACERSLAEALAASPNDRIRQRGVLFGDAHCLPESAPRDRGLDLMVLSQIAEQAEAGSYWDELLPAASPADKERIGGMLKRLMPVLKPRTWRSTRKERIVARPVFLSASQVVLDCGEHTSRLPVERTAFDEDGARLLGRMQRMAVECIAAINQVAAAAGGVPPDRVAGTWTAVREAAGMILEDMGADRGSRALRRLAEHCRTNGNDDSSSALATLVQRVAAQAAMTTLPDRFTSDELAAFDEVLGNSGADTTGPCAVVRGEALVASGNQSRGRDMLEHIMKHARSDEARIEFSRAAACLGRMSLAGEKFQEATDCLQKALSIFKAARGDHAIPPPAVLHDFGRACMATGKSDEGKEALRSSRAASVLSHGPESLPGHRSDDADAGGPRGAGRASDP